MLEKLSFEVAESPVLFNAEGRILRSDEYKVIHRSDDNQPLNVVKNSYNMMLNEHFMESVERMREISGFEFSGYSELKGGGLVLGHLKNNLDDFNIGGNKIQDYLLMGNSHDSSFPFFIGTTSVFISCKNQFSKISQTEKVRHTKNSPHRIDQLLKWLEIYFQDRKQLFKQFEIFNETRISMDTAKLAAEALFGITPEMKLLGEVSTRKINQRNAVTDRMAAEMGRLGDNLWGMLNGVTYYTTHDLENKDSGFGLISGQQAELNAQGYKIANKILAGELV